MNYAFADDGTEKMYADLRGRYAETTEHVPCDHTACPHYAGMMVATVAIEAKTATVFRKAREASRWKILYSSSTRSMACADCSEFRRPDLSGTA